MGRVGTRLRTFAIGAIGAALLLAAATTETPAEAYGLQFVGGATHNTYDIDWEGGPELFQSGGGWSAGLRVQGESGAAFGGRLDYVTGSGSDFEAFCGFADYCGAEAVAMDMSVLGRLMEISAEWTTGGGIDVEPYVAFGAYDGTLDVTYQCVDGCAVPSTALSIAAAIDETTDSFEAGGDVGYLAGVRVGKALTPNLSLHASAGYRWLELDFRQVDCDECVDPRFDLDGYSYGGGVTYEF